MVSMLTSGNVKGKHFVDVLQRQQDYSVGMGIGDRISGLRAAMGLSQRGLAKLAGISPAALCKIETGVAVNIRGSTMNNLARVLDVDANWLESGTGSPVAPKRMDVDHSELLDIFDHLNEANRSALLATGRALLSSQLDVPKVVQPFPPIKSPQ